MSHAAQQEAGEAAEAAETAETAKAAAEGAQRSYLGASRSSGQVTFGRELEPDAENTRC